MNQQKRSLKKLFPASIAALLLLAGIYLAQINSLTAKAYAITAQQQKFASLEGTNKNLQSNRAKNFSVQSFSTLATQLHFEKISAISYIQVVGASVAKR